MIRSNSFSRALENMAVKTSMAILKILEKGKPKAQKPTGEHRVLICKWCCMGDAILSLYAIREFKRLHGNIHIEMLVSSRIAEVYRTSPDIDRVYVLPVTGRRLLLELINPRLWFRFSSMIFHLRGRRFAQFIDLELYRGTGPFLKRLFGIPYSRGFQVQGALPKHHDFEVPRARNMLEWQCFYLILGLDIPVHNPAPLYSRNETNTVKGEKRIGIVYGSSFNWPQKKWPREFFAETIFILAKEGYTFLLFGDTLERKDSAWIMEKCRSMSVEPGKLLDLDAGTLRDTTGTLDFFGLQREVSTCDLIFGNDTGTLHLAAACGIPTITLFGPTDPDKWNGLTSTPLFLPDLACRPCYYLGSMPPCSHFSCLRQLAPVRVVEQIRSLLPVAPFSNS